MSIAVQSKVVASPIRWPIRFLIVFLGATLLMVGLARLAGVSWHASDAETLWQMQLVFVDTAGGSVLVKDSASGRTLAQFDGEQGFLRGTLRALARERKRRGIGPEAPFSLLGRADGRLTLLDPSTAQRIDLESFGPTNSAIFRNFRNL
jgi:putative photosynthetic complex assembly protein